MNIEDFKRTSVGLIEYALKGFGQEDNFTATFDEVFNEEDDRISGSVEIEFKYGNCSNKHIINIGWDKDEGFGIENDEGDIYNIHHSDIVRSMYYDLALKDLDDQFCI